MTNMADCLSRTIAGKHVDDVRGNEALDPL